jgi:hypothetical protein
MKKITYSADIKPVSYMENNRKLCWKEFKTKPCEINIYSNFISELFWGVIDTEFDVDETSINRTSDIIRISNEFITNSAIFIRINKDLYIEFDEYTSQEDSYISNLKVYYNNINIDHESINGFIDLFSGTFEDAGGEVRTFTINNSFDLVSLPLTHKDQKVKISKPIKKMVKNVNKKDRQIYLVDKDSVSKGELNISIKNIKKKVIYLPNNLLEYISSYDIKKILSDGYVLVIEGDVWLDHFETIVGELDSLITLDLNFIIYTEFTSALNFISGNKYVKTITHKDDDRKYI